ncbi:MAG: ABC transporter permease [Chloroflexi bacterium]|nr:ABC transporter permease [Chloroflexota bacterium]
MKRFWILFRTELKAWRHDPVTALGGFIPAIFILLAFALLFGGRLTFKIALINHDTGTDGKILQETMNEVLSPFGTPYYDVLVRPEDEAWKMYHAFDIDGVWVIPSNFSQSLAAGQSPQLAMYFSNYIDDRAKNHRLYAAEILWHFYERIDTPPPPLALAEVYPRPQMIEWFPIIAVGVLLLGFMVGGMMNIFVLTQKEQTNHITLEFGLAPRSLLWVLLPKTVLALLMGLVTGTGLLGLLYLWIGAWPGPYLWAVWLLAGLVILFWVPIALVVGLRVRYFAGAIAVVLTGLTLFFIGGGLGMLRGFENRVLKIAWLFPNTYAVDPLRDLILFHQWPNDWKPVLFKLIMFATVSLLLGWGLVARRLRRLA